MQMKCHANKNDDSGKVCQYNHIFALLTLYKHYSVVTTRKQSLKRFLHNEKILVISLRNYEIAAIHD